MITDGLDRDVFVAGQALSAVLGKGSVPPELRNAIPVPRQSPEDTPKAPVSRKSHLRLWLLLAAMLLIALAILALMGFFGPAGQAGTAFGVMAPLAAADHLAQSA